MVSLAVNDSGIHFINDVRAEVLTCPPVGCPAKANVLAANVAGAQELVAVGDHLVVRSANAVYRVGPGGGSTPVDAYASSRSLTSDGTRYAYYTAEKGSTKIWRLDPAGDAGAEQVLDQNGAHGIATNGARIFFLFDDNSRELMRSCGVADCLNSTSDLVVSGRPTLDTAARLAATKDALFWTRSSGGETCSAVGCGSSTNLQAVPAARAIAVDETYVYFTARADGQNGSVERCSHAGCTDRVTLATGFKPQALVVTAGAIYWATENNGQTASAIWRLAK